MNILNIVNAITTRRVRITDHADEEAEADSLSLADVLQSVLNGEVIEDYPTDKPYPSCLILSATPENEPVHSVWAYNKENGWAVLVTVYRPDPKRWVNWRQRRRKR